MKPPRGNENRGTWVLEGKTFRRVDSDIGDERPLVPKGVRIGRCFSIIDLGTQYNDMYAKWQRKVLITWEIPEYRKEFKDKDGNTFDVSMTANKFYTYMIAEKSNLGKDLSSWLGDDLPGIQLGQRAKATFGQAGRTIRKFRQHALAHISQQRAGRFAQSCPGKGV